MTRPRRHEPLPDDRHNAELVVRVHGLGPGRIGITVTDTGPVPLSRFEQVHVLREAADQVESGQAGTGAPGQDPAGLNGAG